MKTGNKLIAICLLAVVPFLQAQEKPAKPFSVFLDSLAGLEEPSGELLDRIRNMPDIEVGKGITFMPAGKWYKMTLRFRMQNMAAVSLSKDFSYDGAEARVKRLRLRFDGYIFTPKLLYSIQLGFTPYDAPDLPNGNQNIVRDAMIYYMPTPDFSIGFGQSKIKANRARMNSSSALQFIDRSIVSSEFNLDRDFGFFAEYYRYLVGNLHVALKGSVTLGEGRNWSTSNRGGLAYTGRLEVFPFGRFKSLGDIVEGDFEREERIKVLLAAAYSFNNRTNRMQGQVGDYIPGNELRNLNSCFFDFILKYKGFSFYTDFMRRQCGTPFFAASSESCIYTGSGLNVQAGYLFPKNWEIALRNSTLFPEGKVQPVVGYENWNQTSLAVTRYLIGHSLKVQADASYNHQWNPMEAGYTRWQFRFQVELGL